MIDPYRLLRPALFRLDPERAHRMTIAALRGWPVASAEADDPVLATTVAGLSFPNPVGLAAGFDKDAEVPDAMLGLGFGFVEVGTLTPRAQAGNPRPRMFRLAADAAVINRLGFNNGGINAALGRLRARAWARRPGLVGVNVGANKDSADRTADYAAGIEAARDIAHWITINISSPNTPGLRALQSRAALELLLARAVLARGTVRVPLFLKVAPDLTREDVEDIAAAVLEAGIDGIIIGNTTISRPAGLAGPHVAEAGGLSGRPLATLARARLREFRAATRGRVPLIAAGGIDSGAEAYARIRAGASLVQLYTALAFEGPALVRRIKQDLAALLRRDGFAAVNAAVGTDA